MRGEKRCAVWILATPPAGTGGSVSATAIPDEIHVDVLVGRPMALEVVKEGRPVEGQSVLLEVS